MTFLHECGPKNVCMHGMCSVTVHELAPVFEGLLHLEVFKGIVLDGVDEGLRYRVDRELGQNLDED